MLQPRRRGSFAISFEGKCPSNLFVNLLLTCRTCMPSSKHVSRSTGTIPCSRRSTFLSPCIAYALHQDSEFLCGSSSAPLPSASAVRYARHLYELTRDTPRLLLAHAYTRYIGALNSGQVLLCAAVKGLKLPSDGRGTHFYEFGDGLRRLKSLYRARLIALVVSERHAESLVAEARVIILSGIGRTEIIGRFSFPCSSKAPQ